MLLLGLWLSVGVLAQSPPLLNVQGTLKTVKGTSVPDGMQSLTFALFNQEEGGSALWSETAEINIVRGLYNHNLGSVTPLSSGLFQEQLYLGIIANGMELPNRTPMTAAPYVLEILGCKGTVGDVKMSILEPDDFIAENGDCWVLMDGRALNSSDRLAQIKNWQQVPDARGTFIRGYDPSGANDPDRGANPPVGSYQGDSFGAHTHEVGPSDRESIPTYNSTNNTPLPVQMERLKAQYRNIKCENCYTSIWLFQVGNTGQQIFQHPFMHQHRIAEAGGSETRPKNTSYYTYIRIR
jgi:hypothetical protein